ncbi:MAG: DUF1614 domain-containing protein [Colwellia sp.]|jgi:Predicted membrane protein
MPAGLITAICLLLLLFLWPFILMDFMLIALYKLGISPLMGLGIIFCILLGSLINIPVKRIKAVSNVPTDLRPLFGFNPWFPRQVLQKKELIIAVNLGGCVVPSILALYQLAQLFNAGMILMSVIAIIINVIICYQLSEIKAGVGILLPAFVPGVIAALCGLILTPENPPAVAFCAGILGPLIGADLLRLKQIVALNSGTASIGGAGTFDGIVISGFIALLLT